VTGDPENGFETPGDAPPPAEGSLSPPAEPGEQASRPSRRFAAWNAAHREESGPSLLQRASAKLRGLFGRKDSPALEGVEPLDEEQPAAEVQGASAPEVVAETDAPDAQPVLEWSAEPTPGDVPVVDEVVSGRAVEYTGAPAEPGADEAKEDLKFLWSRSDSAADSTDSFTPEAIPLEPAAEAESLSFLYEPAADEPAVLDAHAEAQPEVHAGGEPEVEVAFAPIDERLSTGVPRSLLDDVEEPEKKGFFARIFSRRSKPAMPEPPAIEVAAEDAPEVEPQVAEAADDSAYATPGQESAEPVEQLEAVSSAVDAAALDDALPMDEPAEATLPEPAQAADGDLGATVGLSADEVPVPLPKKRGFFARLLGKADEEPVAAEPVAEAAPEAMASGPEPIEVAGAAFDSARNEYVPEQASADSFASVDDALPLEAAAQLDATLPIDVSALPEPPAEPVEPVAPAYLGALDQSYSAMPVYDFDTPKPDAGPGDADSRSTMEVDMAASQPDDSRPTAEVSAEEIAQVAQAAEEERDTDEFAALDETLVEDAEKTAEVAREPGFFQKLFGKTKEVTQVEPAVAPPPSANPNFLVQKFRTFYNEVVVYKNQKAEFTAGFATAIVTSYDADLSPEQSANSLAMRLQQMLELQLAESSWMGGEAHELYPEAQYAMAVLADEMLTHLEWPGQPAWGAHRLELTVFKTAASDVEFFKRLDRLLKNGPQTAGTRDLARVYLLTIASGFKGKYRPFGLQRPLAEYRRRLYEFVYGGDALLLYADERRIFPEATSVTVAGRGVRKISMAQQWAAILVLLLVGYTVISHITWNRVSAELRDIAARVEQARTASTASDSPNGGGGR